MSGSTPIASRPTISARETTATLICPTTCRIARACETKSRRRAARTPPIMEPPTIAAESKKPAVTLRPPLASNASTIPEGTSANSTSTPVTRPR
jgi:hypothetical protein